MACGAVTGVALPDDRRHPDGNVTVWRAGMAGAPEGAGIPAGEGGVQAARAVDV